MSINELRDRAMKLKGELFDFCMALREYRTAEGYAAGAELLTGYVWATLQVEIDRREKEAAAKAAEVTEPTIDEITWRA